MWFGINNVGVDYWRNGVLKKYREDEGVKDLMCDRCWRIEAATFGGKLLKTVCFN